MDFDRECWICETICGAVYRRDKTLPRGASFLIKDRTRHLTYIKGALDKSFWRS
jgi:hypothetical protein